MSAAVAGSAPACEAAVATQEFAQLRGNLAESSGMPPSTLPSRAWRVTLAPLLFAGALSTSGCGSAGDELRIASPGDADAKALLDVRVEHATQPGDHSADKILVGEVVVTPGEHAVFPQSTRVRVATEFWHEETHVEVQKVGE